MVLTTSYNVTGDYEPTYNWGGPHCMIHGNKNPVSVGDIPKEKAMKITSHTVSSPILVPPSRLRPSSLYTPGLSGKPSKASSTLSACPSYGWPGWAMETHLELHQTIYHLAI